MNFSVAKKNNRRAVFDGEGLCILLSHQENEWSSLFLKKIHCFVA